MARLLKLTSPNMALARCSLPARRHSSALIEILKAAASTRSREFASTNTSILNTERGKAWFLSFFPDPSPSGHVGPPESSPPGHSAMVWDPLTGHLNAAGVHLQAERLAKANEPPEDAWKLRSDTIMNSLRTHRSPWSGKTTKRLVTGAVVGSAGDMEVPSVTSGE